MPKRIGVLVVLGIIFVAGCVPRPAAGPATAWPQGSCKTFAVVPAPVGSAIWEAFAHLGQQVVNEAGRVACCESSWVGGAVPGAYYMGLFQIGQHASNTLRFYSEKRFGPGAYAPYDYWVQSQTARDFYVTRGNTWSAFQCRP